MGRRLMWISGFNKCCTKFLNLSLNLSYVGSNVDNYVENYVDSDEDDIMLSRK